MGTLLLNKSYFNKGRTIFVLAFIIMLASALRLPWYTVGLYGDETINYAYFGFLPLKNIFLNYIDPNQHTFYIFVTRIFRELFGESEIIFRLPALLAGLSAPPILFILAKRLLKSEMTACVAAFLLTVSISHIHYSQRGRGYTFTVLFALLMVYAVLNLLEKRKPILWGFIFALIGFAAVLTLPSNAAFLVAVTFFFTIALCRSEFSFSAFFRFSNMIRFWPFLVCGLIGSGYFWIIFQDL